MTKVGAGFKAGVNINPLELKAMVRRFVRDWSVNERVEDAEVAPHRYLWNGEGCEEYYGNDYKKFLASIPYKVGEVVYVQVNNAAVKARIVDVWFERDNFGDRRPLFQVQLATAKGLWSKVKTKTWPGFIQRGYKLAGLAPDVKD